MENYSEKQAEKKFKDILLQHIFLFFFYDTCFQLFWQPRKCLSIEF